MFEFSRDLRRLFAQARQSEDLGWLELVGVDLLEAEARQQSVDAGRVSCPRPFEAELRAAALWRDHARRTGAAASLDRAERAVRSAHRAAAGQDQVQRAEVERAAHLLAVFDLCGGLAPLRAAEQALDAMGRPHRRDTAALAASVHARIKARLALLDDAPEGPTLDAFALMESALHTAPAGAGADALRLDRAALALEAGLMRRDARLLDQAGRELRELVEATVAEYRPLTRARALVLCGAGLCTLAALAEDAAAGAQGRALFMAAAELFTPDHSPLDWAAIQVAAARYGDASLSALAQAESLTDGQGLVLGALAREARAAAEIDATARLADGVGLAGIEAGLRDRLRRLDPRTQPLDWAADQLALARAAQARGQISGAPQAHVGLMLAEAALTAREHGAPALAARAAACRLDAPVG